MRYKITKLDGRYSYSTMYQYCIEFKRSSRYGTGVLDFDKARRWMNNTWGWSQDVETQMAMARELNQQGVPLDSEVNFHWAYSIQYQDYRIYLKSENELNWFVLANPNEH